MKNKYSAKNNLYASILFSVSSREFICPFKLHQIKGYDLIGLNVQLLFSLHCVFILNSNPHLFYTYLQPVALICQTSVIIADWRVIFHEVTSSRLKSNQQGFFPLSQWVILGSYTIRNVLFDHHDNGEKSTDALTKS